MSAALPMNAPLEAEDTHGSLRILEALLFAATEPLDPATIAERLPKGADVPALIAELTAAYATRGVNVVAVAGRYALRTAPDLAPILNPNAVEPRKLSRAALETLAIIAYHQPVTRAEIEGIRGVSTSRGVLDLLLETGWIRLRGRRRTPGRPVTFGTTPTFLENFNLEAIGDLPGVEELKGTGMFEANLPADFRMPNPSDDTTLAEDEDPLDPADLDLGLAPRAGEGEETDGPA